MLAELTTMPPPSPPSFNDEERRKVFSDYSFLSLSIRGRLPPFPLCFVSRERGGEEEEGRTKDDSKREQTLLGGGGLEVGIFCKLDATLIRRNIFSPRYVCTLICYAFPSPTRIIQVIPAVSS